MTMTNHRLLQSRSNVSTRQAHVQPLQPAGVGLAISGDSMTTKTTAAQDLKTVLDYWLEMVCDGDDRPPEVVLAMCRLKWPDHDFEIDRSKSEPADLCCLDAMVDVKTGRTAADLMREGVRDD